MGERNGGTTDYEDLDWVNKAVFDALFDEAEDDEEPDELRVVTRRIASNYCETLADAARGWLRHEGGPHLSSIVAACHDLHRLATATEDAEQRVLLEALLARREAFDGSRRGRDSFATYLRNWLHEFSDLVGEAAVSAAQVVRYDPEEVPLFQALAQLRGIGAKRLERLYVAGLSNAEAFASATPEEVASVTGLPLGLAESVLVAAHTWQQSRWRRDVSRLVRALDRFEASVREGPEPTPDERVVLSALFERLARVARAADVAVTSARPMRSPDVPNAQRDDEALPA
jgi:hypothetical protein